jgi:hypothetical protein
MKYLKKYNESRGETLIDKKIVFLNDITDDLRDRGYGVDIFNGSLIRTDNQYLGRIGKKQGLSSEDFRDGNKYIYLMISHPVLNRDDDNDRVWNHSIVKNLIERLQRSKIGWRGMSGYEIGTSLHYQKVLDGVGSHESIATIRIDKRSTISREDLENLIS